MPDKTQSKTVVTSIFTWATSSWWSRFIFGISILIIAIRLSTTCIAAFGIEIGCEEGADFLPIEEEYGPKEAPKL